MVTIIVIVAITVNEKSPADQMFFHQIFMEVTDSTSWNFVDEPKALGHLNGPLHAQLHHGRALHVWWGRESQTAQTKLKLCFDRIYIMQNVLLQSSYRGGVKICSWIWRSIHESALCTTRALQRHCCMISDTNGHP